MAKGEKTGGRTKGTPNRTSLETKELLKKIVNKEIDGLGAILEKLEPTERINAISKLLPYILSKQTEIKAEITQPVTKTPEERQARIAELIAKVNQ